MEKNWQSLIRVIRILKSDNELSLLLDFLFTLEEKRQLSNRYALAQQMVLAQKSQREIAKDLGVSISTVTRCSNALKLLPDEIKQKFKL